MRIASFVADYRSAIGIVTDHRVREIKGKNGQPASSLKALLAANPQGLGAVVADGPEHALADVRLLPVIPDPDKIICIGLNYKAHIAESNHGEIPYPVIFTRFANSQVGSGEALILPKVSVEFDYEGELALVIGRRGRHIKAADAYDYVAGYSCYNDGSIRDYQRHSRQFTPGKNFVGTGGFGPWLVTPDESGPPEGMTLSTRLNGEVLQHTEVSDLLFTVPELIAYCSTFTELVPGDVIVTGTPGGVGAFRTPKLWMKAGDIVEVEISGIGVLRNSVVAE